MTRNPRRIRNPHPPPPSELFTDETALRKRCLKCGIDSDNLTILDCRPDNILNYTQGDWSLIRRDLSTAGVSKSSLSDLEDEQVGTCSSIITAFHLRKELVHYKKVCLQVFEESRFLEKELKLMSAFFFWSDEGRSVEEGIRAHCEAICDEVGIEAAEAEVEVHVSGEESFSSLLRRKRMYVFCSRAMMRHRGATRAVHDARDVIKAICMSPRHPGEIAKEALAGNEDKRCTRPRTLRDLPRSMNIYRSCEVSMADDPISARRGGRRSKDTSSPINGYFAPTSFEHTEKSSLLPLRCPGQSTFRRVLERTRNELSWPVEAVNFLSASIIARGGYKALSMVEELRHYYSHLENLIKTVESILQRYHAVHNSVSKSLSETQFRNVGEDHLSAASKRDGTIHFMEGALDICKENARWVKVMNDMVPVEQDFENNSDEDANARLVQDGRDVIAGTVTEPPGRPCPSSLPWSIPSIRLFVTRDDVPTGRACAFVPADFRLGHSASVSRRLLENVLKPAMLLNVEIEKWPPPPGETRRTRVGVVNSRTGRRRKPVSCNRCVGLFDPLWVRHGLCTICEALERQQRAKATAALATNKDHDNTCAGCCIFDTCPFRTSAYCPHSARCFACDVPHSCEERCRFSRGDGQVALALVETICPSLLLLDFDRTLASTKAGASPIPLPLSSKTSGNTSTMQKDKVDSVGFEGVKLGRHTIDADLKAAVKAQFAYGGISCVVTRNSHKTEIEQFLIMHGMSDLAMHVHVVPKRKSKGSFIRDHFFSHNEDENGMKLQEREKTCLFIDDDIHELVTDSWLREDPRIHRLLFARVLG